MKKQVPGYDIPEGYVPPKAPEVEGELHRGQQIQPPKEKSKESGSGEEQEMDRNTDGTLKTENLKEIKQKLEQDMNQHEVDLVPIEIPKVQTAQEGQSQMERIKYMQSVAASQE